MPITIKYYIPSSISFGLLESLGLSEIVSENNCCEKTN